MKKVVLLFLCLVLLCGLFACDRSKGSDVTFPNTDYVYDMTVYEHFSSVFDENSEIYQGNKGAYTIGLTGLGTDVTVAMDGKTVVSISAYGHTQELNLLPFQDQVNAAIEASDGAVVIHDMGDYSCTSWILTEYDVFIYEPIGDISTEICVTARFGASLTPRLTSGIMHRWTSAQAVRNFLKNEEL